MRPYPLFLLLEGREVTVVGGGEVATRKIVELLDAGARVHVVALETTAELHALAAQGRVSLEKRAFRSEDVRSAFLIVAATDSPAAQQAIGAACEADRRFCLAVDDLPNTSAYGAALLRRGPITLAISTGGQAPALAKLLRMVLEEVLPDDDVLARAAELRERWKAEKRPMGERFDELVRALAARRAKG